MNCWSMKKFLGGLLVGVGIAIGFLVTAWVGLPYVMQRLVFSTPMEPVPVSPTVATVGFPKNRGYAGSTGLYSGNFPMTNADVLAGGPAEIQGRVSSADNPIPGLRLRLPLNSKVLSQWAVTDDDGVYHIPVPEGRYVINGFELDGASANTVLAGLIPSPNLDVSSGSFAVHKGQTAKGLDLAFVAPVEKAMSSNQFRASESVDLKWRPYPGARTYKVQLYQRDSFRDSPKALFGWQHLPEVSSTSLRPVDYGVSPQPGHKYYFTVDAYSTQGIKLSETEMAGLNYDFSVSED